MTSLNISQNNNLNVKSIQNPFYIEFDLKKSSLDGINLKPCEYILHYSIIYLRRNLFQSKIKY